MIKRAEIEEKSREFDIHAANVERDYVYGWLLMGIYTVSDLKDVLILKGGNCFRKAYFLTTRFSNDLDFATQTAIEPEHLHQEFNKACSFVQEAMGVQFVLERTRVELKAGAIKDKTIYEARLYFNDFYGKPGSIVISVRLDITEFDKIYLPLQSRNLIHPYSDAADCTTALKCVKLEELAAGKLICLLQRRHLADLFDYVFCLFFNRDVEVNRAEIVTTFFRKTIFERNRGVARELLLGVPLEAFRATWKTYILCPLGARFDFDEAVDRFRTSIMELFEAFTGMGGERRFFSSALRNLILEAGTERRLLRLTYDGVTRDIEPYSLAYKVRQDGLGQEYFYAWDRSGGRSGTEGIKSFLSSKVQQLEGSPETFEPRFDIELTKTVEVEQKGYFSRRFGGGRGRTHSSSDRVYLVQCSYCNKTFRRKTRSTALKKHKDPYGNECYGRRGYSVDVL